MREVVVLPQPDSPTSPSVSPALDVEGDVVDRLDVAERAREQDALGEGEVLAQLLDAQQGTARRSLA